MNVPAKTVLRTQIMERALGETLMHRGLGSQDRALQISPLLTTYALQGMHGTLQMGSVPKLGALHTGADLHSSAARLGSALSANQPTHLLGTGLFGTLRPSLVSVANENARTVNPEVARAGLAAMQRLAGGIEAVFGIELWDIMPPWAYEYLPDGTRRKTRDPNEIGDPMSDEGLAIFASSDSGAQGNSSVTVMSMVGGSHVMETSQVVSMDAKQQADMMRSAIEEMAKGPDRNEGAESMKWFRALASGIKRADSTILRLPIVRAARELTQRPIIVRSSLTPRQRTPWGLEEWIISGDARFGSRFPLQVDGKEVMITLDALIQLFPAEFLGEKHLAAFGHELPFLLKRLHPDSWSSPNQDRDGKSLLDEAYSVVKATRLLSNSQLQTFEASHPNFFHENFGGLNYHEIHTGLVELIPVLRKINRTDLADKLSEIYGHMINALFSVQIHPTQAYVDQMNTNLAQGAKPWGIKIEGWEFRPGPNGVGGYFGLKDGVTIDDLERVTKDNGDILALLNFVPIRDNDGNLSAVWINPGVIHAYGRGGSFWEPQTPDHSSETVTARVYDYLREPRRPVHLENVVEILRGLEAAGQPQGQALLDQIVRHPILQSPTDGMQTATIFDETVHWERIVLPDNQAVFSGNTKDTGPQGFAIERGRIVIEFKDGAAWIEAGFIEASENPEHTRGIIIPAGVEYRIRAQSMRGEDAQNQGADFRKMSRQLPDTGN